MNSGIVYLVDENNLIISEMKMDFSRAVAQYLNKRDQKGRRYIISVEGAEVPYKKKPKKLVIDRHKSGSSEESNQNPTDEPSL